MIYSLLLWIYVYTHHPWGDSHCSRGWGWSSVQIRPKSSAFTELTCWQILTANQWINRQHLDKLVISVKKKNKRRKGDVACAGGGTATLQSIQGPLVRKWCCPNIRRRWGRVSEEEAANTKVLPWADVCFRKSKKAKVECGLLGYKCTKSTLQVRGVSQGTM